MNPALVLIFSMLGLLGELAASALLVPVWNASGAISSALVHKEV